MKAWTHVLYTALSVLVLNGSQSHSFGRPYQFINIADTSGPFRDIDVNVGALNDDGVVAFQATLDSGIRGVFTGSGGPITTIADSVGPYNTFGAQVGINNGGVVAFAARLDDQTSGVYTKSGGLTTTIATGGGASQFTSVDGAEINESNSVVFAARRNSFLGGIYTSDNGALIPIFEGLNTETAILESTIGINDNGTVAFMLLEATPSGSRNVIYTGDGGPLTTIATSADYAFLRVGEPIANNDKVIFGGVDRANPANFGPFTGQGGPVTAIIGTSATGLQALSDGDAMAIDNFGGVAFIGNTSEGGTQPRGIYTGPDPIKDKVIREGDPLFGSVVTLLYYDILELNDRGSIAFHYQLANGVKGLAVAAVPEPASTAMIISGAFAVVLLMRRPMSVV